MSQTKKPIVQRSFLEDQLQHENLSSLYKELSPDHIRSKECDDL